MVVARLAAQGRRELGGNRPGIRHKSRPEARAEQIPPRWGQLEGGRRRRRRCSRPSWPRHRAERPRPIPCRTGRWRRRSSATGRCTCRPVTASRRALARVGKRAATTGDTIHLAHAAPGAGGDRPRADPRRPPSPVAALLRRRRPRPRGAPGRAGRGDHAPGADPAPHGRRGDGRAPPSAAATSAASGGTVARPPSRRRSPATGGSRRAAGHRRPPPVAPRPRRSATARSRRLPVADRRPADHPPPHGADRQPTVERRAGDRRRRAQFDRILELLEDRIITELERRGGRFRGGF